jgi:UDP-N-acetylmuramyl pentapeptide phosphotransferase/UDP-N-acetylglucosamine-1-phosphate transferase
VRFATHSLGAILIIVGFGYWKTVNVPIFDNLHLGWWGLPITFFWIVGLTNAYNFMDGIDGIAGGQGVVAGLGWAVLGWLSDQPMIGALGLLLASTSLGFLGHNWPPARIFMGDVGSAFLGYNFAAIPVITAQFDTRLPLAGIMIMWPFIFDTSFTLLRRLLKGENIFIAHRFHIYQRLVAAGYSHFFVTFLYSMMAMIGAIFAIAWFMRLKRGIIDGTLIIPFLCLILWVFVIRKERLRELKIKRIRE